MASLKRLGSLLAVVAILATTPFPLTAGAEDANPIVPGGHEQDPQSAGLGVAFNESSGCGPLSGTTPPASVTNSTPNRTLPLGHQVRGPWGDFFGRNYQDVAGSIVSWTVPMSGGQAVNVHRRALPAFERVTDNLQAAAAQGKFYDVRLASTWVWRRVGGSYRMSMHSFGTSIDINWDKNPHRSDGKLVTDIPQWFVDAWSDAGFCWGGYWDNSKDAMHFSWMGPARTQGYGLVPAPFDSKTSPVDFSNVDESVDTPLYRFVDPSLMLADVDRDGADDLVVAQPWDNSSIVLTALEADGSFASCSTSTDLVEGLTSSRVLFADHNRDGRPDAISVERQGNSVRLRISDLESVDWRGDRVYSAPQSISTPITWDDENEFFLADYDKDTHPDLLVVTRGSATTGIEVWSGSAGFQSRIVDAEISFPSTLDHRHVRVAIADTNTDGVPDLLTTRMGSRMELRIVSGIGGFTSPVQILKLSKTPDPDSSYLYGDYDGDGRVDMYRLGPDGELAISLGGAQSGDLDYWFITPEGGCIDRDRTVAVAADVDADGDDDLIYLGHDVDGRWHVVDGLGAGTSSAWTGAYSTDEDWLAIDGDFDGDGREDVAVFNPVAARWRVLRSTGTSFVDEDWTGYFSNISGWTAVPGDFDGDGRTDVAVFHPLNGKWLVLRSTGSGFSVGSWTSQFSSKGGWTAVPGDFDGDGRTDVAVFHPLNGKWLVLRSTGSGFSVGSWTSQFSSKGGWTAVPGDFDGDGRTDVAVFHPLNGKWLVLRSTGSGFSVGSWTSQFSSKGGWTAVPGDFDGDGRTDVAVFHPLNGKWLVLRSRGSSFSVQTWTDRVTSALGFGVVAGDSDGDGDDDLAMSHLAHGPWLTFESTGGKFEVKRAGQ